MGAGVYHCAMCIWVLEEKGYDLTLNKGTFSERIQSCINSDKMRVDEYLRARKSKVEFHVRGPF